MWLRRKEGNLINKSPTTPSEERDRISTVNPLFSSSFFKEAMCEDIPPA